MRRFVLAFVLLAGAWMADATVAAAVDDAPPIGQMAPSDIPEMPLSEVVRNYGDWTVQQSSAFVAAMTYSQEGALFGLLCRKTCAYYINLEVPCAVGSVDTGLFNAPGGSLAVTLRCLHVKEEGEELDVMLIDEDLTELLAGADKVSITIPLPDGQSQVATFSMRGSEEARLDMLDMATERMHRPLTTL